jgi:hypothetical protein
MVGRVLCIGLSIAALVVLGLPAAASAEGLQSYKVKFTGWPADQAGYSVAIGDVNGDGIPDYIIGDSNASPNGEADAGSVYVVYGEASDTTTSRTVDLSQIPLAGQGSSTLGYRIDGWAPGDHFGQSVAVGDLNDATNPETGDPIDDIVVGDPEGSPLGRSGAGEVYVIYGRAGTSTPELDVSTLSPTEERILAGWSAGDHLGTSVAVGPFNHGATAGYPKTSGGCGVGASKESIAIGDPNASPNGLAQAGEVYDIYGDQLAASPSSTVWLDLQNLSSQTGYMIDGASAGEQLGASVADGGNVNKNCNDAILMGAPDASPVGSQSGAVFVSWGRSQLSYPGNENAGTLYQYGQGYEIEGPVAGSHYGYSVADAGDIDGGSVPAVIAGAPNWDNGAGEAIVTYGQTQNDVTYISTTSLSATGNPYYGFAIQGYTQDYHEEGTECTQVSWTANSIGSAYNSASPHSACPYFTAWVDGPAGKPYPNSTSVTAEGDRAGTSVAGLGDVNGHGVTDVLVGTPGWNQSAGAVQVIYGHKGRNQGNIALYANGQGLTSSEGYTLTDWNTPASENEQSNPFSGDSAQADQFVSETQEGQCGVGPNAECVYASNYMWEPGDQAGIAAAATGTGSSGLALIGAPTYGTSTTQSFSGMPQNPTVWYDDGVNYNQIGDQGQGYSGEIDWDETPGSGAAYLLAF